MNNYETEGQCYGRLECILKRETTAQNRENVLLEWETAAQSRDGELLKRETPTQNRENSPRNGRKQYKIMRLLHHIH